jgi:ABC-type dipeptide/oligopeptide/nickel transport system permease subunit
MRPTAEPSPTSSRSPPTAVREAKTPTAGGRPDRSMVGLLLRHPSGRAGIVGLVMIGIAVVVGPLLMPYGPTDVDFGRKLQPPTRAHPLGTDHLGRDLLTRTLDGGRRTLGTALVVVGAVLCVAVVVGAVAGFTGGAVDAAIMRAVDALLAIPALVLALALVGVFGVGLPSLIVALTFAQAPWYTRVIRAIVLRERDRPYVLVARVHGAGPVAVLHRHILPALAGQVAVLATLDLGAVILGVAGLSFLGLGAQPPLPEWGAMLNDGRLSFSIRPLLMLAPGACIFLTVLAANLAGDALRDVLDPSGEGRSGAGR